MVRFRVRIFTDEMSWWIDLQHIGLYRSDDVQVDFSSVVLHSETSPEEHFLPSNWTLV